MEASLRRYLRGQRAIKVSTGAEKRADQNSREKARIVSNQDAAIAAPADAAARRNPPYVAMIDGSRASASRSPASRPPTPATARHRKDQT